MDFERERIREESRMKKENEINSIKNEEKNLYKKLEGLIGQYINSKVIFDKKNELKNKTIADFKKYFESLKYEIEEGNECEIVAFYGNMKVILNPYNEYSFHIKIPNKDSNCSFFIEESDEYIVEQNYKGHMNYNDEITYMGYVVESELNTREFINKQIECLNKDIDKYNNLINNIDSVKLVYKFHESYGKSGEYNSIEEILKEI